MEAWYNTYNRIVTHDVSLGLHDACSFDVHCLWFYLFMFLCIMLGHYPPNPRRSREKCWKSRKFNGDYFHYINSGLINAFDMSAHWRSRGGQVKARALGHSPWERNSTLFAVVLNVF